jgi:hypothetical protein
LERAEFRTGEKQTCTGSNGERNDGVSAEDEGERATHSGHAVKAMVE